MKHSIPRSSGICNPGLQPHLLFPTPSWLQRRNPSPTGGRGAWGEGLPGYNAQQSNQEKEPAPQEAGQRRGNPLDQMQFNTTSASL